MSNLLKREILQELLHFLSSPEAIVITGIRRSGKTSLLKLIYEKISSSNKLMLDLENPIYRKIFAEENYETIKTKLQSLGLDFSQKVYLFLDEIQFVKNLPSVAKYFIDHYKVKFFLTGSASFYLKNLFTESLAGRKFIFELYPLSFKEFLQFKGVKLNPPYIHQEISETTWKLFEPYWEEYVKFGSFPEIALSSTPSEKRKKLEEIFSSYFQKEIEQLSDFRKKEKIQELILLLAENVGNLLDIERLSRELRVSRITVEEWLYFLQSTYLITLVPPLSKRKHIAIRKRKKVYFVDWGLAKAIADISIGQMFENCIFHLLRLKGKVNFYRERTGKELDFVLRGKTGFEVKLQADIFDEKRAEKFREKLKLKKTYLISYRYKKGKNIKPGFCL